MLSKLTVTKRDVNRRVESIRDRLRASDWDNLELEVRDLMRAAWSPGLRAHARHRLSAVGIALSPPRYRRRAGIHSQRGGSTARATPSGVTTSPPEGRQ